VSAAAIEVAELTKRFGSFVAVDGISFTVGKGEVFGLLGPNGAGKSTTIRMLCGILGPTAGRGTVAGHDIGREPEAVRARIGYMSQRFSLYLDLTVAENLRFYGGIYGVPQARLRERQAWASFPPAGGRGWPWDVHCSTSRKWSSSTSPRPVWTRSRGVSSGP